MELQYTVCGLWPFPLDMLRHDRARPATPADSALIERLSKAESENGFGLREAVSVNLVMNSGEPTTGHPNGRHRPTVDRWQSFGWQVDGIRPVEA